MTAKETTCESGKDAATEQAIEHARELVSELDRATGPVDQDQAENLLTRLGEDLGVPIGVGDLQITPDSGPDDTHWIKHGNLKAPCLSAGPLITVEYSHRNTVSKVRLEQLPSTNGRVEFGLDIEAEVHGAEIEHGGIMELSPEQARSFAAALVASAEEADQA